MADPAQFRFDLAERVRFINMGSASDALGPVIHGRMHDTNGHHYEVRWFDGGRPRRAWFSENQLSNVPA